ncbi:MAG: hypothetical protein R3F41_20105 [Gammaproteobacteria bacterium]|nr:hypothetical protein [Planctomycetaceae bacterium]MCB1672699.1 hypothetical protein [Pseudomonadales bacterium]MCP5346451.1 hypothetical protein [Pseudomonadales bacterium]
MGRLIYFEDHHPGQGRAAGPDWSPAAMKPERSRRSATGESLIPLQLALDEYDIEKCFAQLARFGRCSVIPRANPADAGKILFLVRIRDAIALNRHLLELEDDDNAAAGRRIDQIQMLENCEESLVSKAWDRIGLETSVSFAGGSGSDSFDQIRQ